MNLSRIPNLFLISMVSLCLLLLPGYARQEEKKESLLVGPSRFGGTYRVPLMGNPSTLDPAYVQDQFGVAVVQQIFDGLVQFDPYLMVFCCLQPAD